jgi:fructosamine-3-kinase
MSTLPPGLATALSTVLGCELQQAIPLAGGMINRAAQVDTDVGALFIKWKSDAPLGFFAAEADGLRRLRELSLFRVPAVLAWHDRSAGTDASATDAQKTASLPLAVPDETPPFLALEYLPPRQPTSERAFATQFGEALAALHRESPAPDSRFGLDRDNFIGLLPQFNAPLPDWPTFYRERRLLPQMALARTNGLLPPERERLLTRLVEELEDLLAGHRPQPALLHGDLWSGNYLPLGKEIGLVDPAAYYGDREMELAYIELFGGFPSGLLAAYRAAFPLEAEYEDRRPLHQLYPLLNHLNHFGETYGPSVDAICRRYAPS